MNLEEKAKNYSKQFVVEARQMCEFDYKNGFKDCKSDVIEFLTANQKATVKQVLEHLNGMK